MASPSITNREKEINKFIKHLNLTKIKTEDYNKSPNRDSLNNQLIDKEFDIKYYSDVKLPNNISTKIIDDAILRAKQTERFFGFALWRVSLPLLLNLSCTDYAEYKTIYKYNIKSNKNNEDEYMQDIEKQLEKLENDIYIRNLYSDNCYIDISQKYQDWKNYCNTIDEIPSFMALYYKDFSSLHIREKQKIIDKLASISITAPIAEYLQKHNSLTAIKLTKAKEEKLLSLNMPRLNNPKIVKKFVEIYIKNKDTQI